MVIDIPFTNSIALISSPSISSACSTRKSACGKLGSNDPLAKRTGRFAFVGAHKSYQDSLAIAEQLAQSDPGNAGWQRDLSVSYDNVGDVQVAQRDLAGALKSYRDSLAIRERLAQSDPGNAGWQRDLSVLYEKVGKVQMAQGDVAGALQSYRDGRAIAERLAQSDPSNAGW